MSSALQFNAAYYLAQYADVRAAVAAGLITAENHWKQFGWREERNPNVEFNTAFYAANNPDVVGAKVNYLDHYLANGAKEGRKPSAAWASTDLTKFDKAAYLAANPDVAAAKIDALQHYMLFGRFPSENRPGAKLLDGTPVVPPTTGSGTGQTFTLTASADNIVGTAGNDTIGGVNAAGVAPQFTLVDVIDGGAGTDTLKLQLNAAYTGGATIKNVEKLQVSLGGANFSANGITGLTEVELLAEGDSYSALGNVVNMAVTGVAGAAGATTFTFADTAVAGSADAAKLTLNNVATAGNTTVNINNTTTLTGNTGLETLTVDLAGPAGVGANAVTLATNATQSLTTLKITGASAGNLTLAANPAASITTIDASAATGGVTVTGIGATNTTVTGGSGNDAFVFGVGNYNTADVVDGGAGTDTLGADTANLAAVTTVNANVKNIETIRVVDDLGVGTSVINLANFGATNVRIAGQALAGAETLTINNLGSTSNVRLDAAIAANILTLNVKDATLPGTADHVTFDLRGATGGGDTYNAAMAGVETVTVNLSNAGSAQTLVLGDAALNTLNVVNTGAQNFVTNFQTAATNTAVSKVDLSGVTGTGTNSVTLVAASSTGAQVTGSANADTIVATNNVDVINGGAGNDQITGLNGGDIINVGTGTDNVIYTAAAQTLQGVVTSGTTVLTGADIITGMGVGDTITLFAAATVTGATAISTSLLASAGTTDTIALVKGSYNAGTGIFTASTTGADTLAQWDSNGTTAGGTIESVVLLGYAGTASSVGANLLTLG